MGTKIWNMTFAKYPVLALPTSGRVTDKPRRLSRRPRAGVVTRLPGLAGVGISCLQNWFSKIPSTPHNPTIIHPPIEKQ